MTTNVCGTENIPADLTSLSHCKIGQGVYIQRATNQIVLAGTGTNRAKCASSAPLAFDCATGEYFQRVPQAPARYGSPVTSGTITGPGNSIATQYVIQPPACESVEYLIIVANGVSVSSGDAVGGYNMAVNGTWGSGYNSWRYRGPFTQSIFTGRLVFYLRAGDAPVTIESRIEVTSGTIDYSSIILCEERGFLTP